MRYNKVAIRSLWLAGSKPHSGEDANDLPMVLSLDLDGYILLSASDLNGIYEAYAAAPCDVLKVAHHGSKNSTWDGLLDFISPSMALVTCPAGSATLPAKETMECLADQGISV